MTTGDVGYSLRFSLIKILPEPGFYLGSTVCLPLDYTCYIYGDGDDGVDGGGDGSRCLW